jgi:hypothetical protein
VLGELNPARVLPPLIEPLRHSDRPRALLPSHRLSLSRLARAQFGNPAGVTRDRAFDYTDPGRHAEGATYMSGRWTSASKAHLLRLWMITIRYPAMDVNLVLAPRAEKPVNLEIFLSDGQRSGENMKSIEGRSIVTVDKAGC